MAVTTSYNWLLFDNLTDYASQDNPGVIGLGNGGFASIFDAGGSVFGPISDSNGGFVANLSSTGLNASLAQLSNGNVVIASELAGDIIFKIVNSASGIDVVPSINASVNGGGITSSNAEVLALAGGGFWIAEQTDFPNAGGDPDHDIVVFRRNNDGTAAGSFTVDNSLADDTDVSIAQLDNGNVAVAWTRTIGTSSQAWSAIYTAAGAVVKAPVAFDASGTVNRNVHVTATDSGFAIIYEGKEVGAPSVDIYLATFNLAGTASSTVDVSSFYVGSEFNESDPTVTRLANGLLAVAYSENSHADTDTVLQLFDPAAGVPLGGTFVDGSRPSRDDSQLPEMARVGVGGVAVIYHDITSGTVNGERLEVQRTSIGDDFGNIINGNDFRDNITGLGGDDTLNGGGNNDIVVGGFGHDVINGGDAADALFGGEDSDTINGGNGGDSIFAMTEGNAEGDSFGDVMHGNNDSDTITGSAGADTIFGDQGIDTLHGGSGDDTLYGGTETDTVDGGLGLDTASYAPASGAVTVILTELAAGHTGGASSGADGTDTLIDIENITGSGFGDNLSGNSFANVLNGLAGADMMQGGLGNDTYCVDNVSDKTDETGGGGTGDYVYASVSFTTAAGIERLYLTGSNAINATGRAGQNDILVGNTGNNVMNGLTGADLMRGGLGNDTYYVDSSGDTTDEVNGGGGTGDYVFASVSFTAAAGIERFYLTGTAAINATGNATQNDILVGNSANNVINGLAGADLMRGGLGNDTYYVDNIGDTTDEVTGGGGISDYVYSSVSFTEAAGIERLYLTGTAISGTGRDAQNDIITGNASANTLSGLSGDDLLVGGLGNDSLNGGAGLDIFRFDTLANTATNMDTITAFVATDDTIQLENAIFTALTTTGTLAAGAFNTGTTATQADDRIIYNTATGALLYDADGLNGAAAVQFALISGHPALTNADFFVY
jgi:Ca2+-binding RTX toxin-like protein